MPSSEPCSLLLPLSPSDDDSSRSKVVAFPFPGTAAFARLLSAAFALLFARWAPFFAFTGAAAFPALP
jgi:hypothetical protein